MKTKLKKRFVRPKKLTPAEYKEKFASQELFISEYIERVYGNGVYHLNLNMVKDEEGN